jgi:hypothetical protein
MITIQPDDAMVARTRPHPTDPNWCYWDKFTSHRQPREDVARRHGVDFQRHDAADVALVARPEHDEFTQEDVIAGRKTMTLTIDQDVHYIRDVLAGNALAGLRVAGAVRGRGAHPAPPRLARPLDGRALTTSPTSPYVWLHAELLVAARHDPDDSHEAIQRISTGGSHLPTTSWPQPALDCPGRRHWTRW